MQLIATYCAKIKNPSPEPLPAHLRYISTRIRIARELALDSNDKFAILSGSFGLITGDQLIPYYDHLLIESEIPLMVGRVADTLKNWRISSVTWHSLPDELDPYVWRYRAVITRACEEAGALLKTVEVIVE